MSAVAELGQLLGKDAWTAEDIRQFQDVVVTTRAPLHRLREEVGELARANPQASGAVAVKLGIARYLLNQVAEALEVLSSGTDNKERRFYQALCHKRLGQADKALENFQYAGDRGWESLWVAVEKAETLCLAGRAGEAETVLKKTAAAGQQDADWQYVQGLAAELQGAAERAVAAYERARALCPGHPGATFRLAYHADLHGDDETAVELYRQCIARSENPAAGTRMETRAVYANALLNLAVIYEDFARYDEAARLLRRILAVNPAHARAKLFLRDVQASKTMNFDEDEAKRIARRNDLLAIPVTDFELSVRARNCLKKMNIRSLGDLLHVTEAELLTYKNFGETSLAEIKTMLASKGLHLGQMREDAVPPPAEEDAPEGTPSGSEGVLATPLPQIEFSVRARKALERLNLRTLGDLANRSEAELLACRNFGQTSLNEVRQRLAEYGLRLRQD